MGKRGLKVPRESWPARLSREPLVQFTLLAAVLFFVNYLFAPDEREKIVVTQGIIDDLTEKHSRLQHAEVSDVQRRNLIEGFVEDEILAREAAKQGLDRDQQVRNLMAQKMRLILREDFDEPTPDQLRRCYESNRLRFHVPKSLTLEQVYYPKGKDPDPGVLDKLKNGAHPYTFGESIEALKKIDRPLLQRELATHVGPDYAQRVFALPVDQWTGPIESLLGTHFVRVVDYFPAREPSYEDVEKIIQREWQFFRMRQIASEKVAELRKEYDIEIADETTNTP